MSLQKILVIQANQYADINKNARDALSEVLRDLVDIDDFRVPSAFETPLFAQKFARTGKYVVIICVAFIPNDGICNHDFMSQSVNDGLIRVSLEEDLPILSLCLTPLQFQDSKEHRQFFRKHFFNKGNEVGASVLQILGLKRESEPQNPVKKSVNKIETHQDLSAASQDLDPAS